jgi:predicted O-linked N-acetylglucosamine transferase (SPINDLY family)
MPEEVFVSTLRKITGEGLALPDLITAATLLVEARQPGLAEQLYRVWIGFNPEHPQLCIALFNCAGLRSEAGDIGEATAMLERAIARNPDFLPGYVNLGAALERAGQADRAIETWRAGAGRPMAMNGQNLGYALTALKQIGRVLSDHQKLDLAEAALQQYLALDPREREVLEQYLAMRLGQCKWPSAAPWEGVDRNTLVRGMHPLSASAYTDDPMLQLAAAFRYVREAIPQPSDLEFDQRARPIAAKSRRLRIGYVSSDLRDHAVGYLLAELFEVHDRAKVEVFAYYCGRPSTEGLHERIKAAAENWRDIRALSDADAARMIIADGIDVLVDVNGHTRDARTGVFALRPAPVQINWLGYPGTMGSPYHQYIIADDWIIPPEHELYFSEKVLRVPCYQANDRRRTVATERPTRAQAGLPDNAFVFCCFNGAQKITRFTFDRWMQILREVPSSVLWLLDCGEPTMARLRQAAVERGVDSGRIVFAPKIQNAHHLARYPLADLFLDTAPYGAHTTASDALWMAVPVLTLSGRGFASRVCGSLVRSAGVPELVCATPEEYLRRAVGLAGAPEELAGYRKRLEAGRLTCDLFNTDQLVSRLEALYREVAEAHDRGEDPRPDLRNLEVYLEVGAQFDHEVQEMLAVQDYAGLYRSRLGRRHLVRPIPADGRLWGEANIAAAEREAFGTPEPAPARARRAANG